MIAIGFTISFWTAFRGAIFVPLSTYQTTQGTITHSDSDYVSGSKNGGYIYDIRYSYTVGQQKYSSSQVSFGAWGGTYTFVEDMVEKYPVGKHIQVYYRASKPSFAVLEPTNTGQTKPVFAITVILYVVGALGLAWSLTKKQR